MYRKEYPRPQFERDKWLNLNGTWQFSFDDYQAGEEERWFQPNYALKSKIEVPFCFQSKLSGIEDTTCHDYVWYKRNFTIPKEWLGKKIILHFGAVDYQAFVYVNGKFVGEHVGGHTPFSLDITNFLTYIDDQITVRVFDPSKDEEIPRGKQYWHEKSAAIWYTRTTGIWQTVWLEPVEKVSLANVKFTSDFDQGIIFSECFFDGHVLGKTVKTKIYYQDQLVIEDSQILHDSSMKKAFYLFDYKIDRSDYHGQGWTWTPETPNLWDVVIEIFEEEKCLDKVKTYFGMRKVHTQDEMIYLNNRPFYQKLVLDQGYWPDSLMTAPTDEDFIRDIQLAKEMGFNGCRKHQKIEDPRFLYWADKLGFIVWGECASPSVYSDRSVERVTNEWFEILNRDYNHPCILTWVPINESWGVPEISVNRQQQHFSQAIYHLIHSIDPTRLVVSNDGWEMTETDICGIHSYVHGNKDEVDKYEEFKEVLRTRENILKSQPNRRRIYCQGYEDKSSPILLTEFGGIGFGTADTGWGYTQVDNEASFLEDYERVLRGVYVSEILNGYCYTQLTDVEQETNGLLTKDREPKVPLDKIKKINDTWHSGITK